MFISHFRRRMIGATSPLAADPGTIRGDLAIITGKNIMYVHVYFYLFLFLQPHCIFLTSLNAYIVTPSSFRSHGSDSKESAEAEISLWFKPEELNTWKKTDLEAWVYE